MIKRGEKSIKRACDLMNDCKEYVEDRYMLDNPPALLAIYGAAVLFESLERLEDILLRKRINTRIDK